MTPVSFIDRPECPLCGGDDTAVHMAFPEIPVLRCRGCGFLYSGKVLSDGDQALYYAQNFGSARHMRGQMVNAEINSRILAGLLNLDEVQNLLDVGTGYGFLLDALQKRHGLETTGIELSRQEAEYAKDRLGLNVINAPLSASGLAKGSFDLVSAFEVIEHTTRPAAFVDELTEYVKPGGYLLIMTDNFEGRMAKALGAGFPKWIPHAHISHFSAVTLERTLRETKGLVPVKSVSYTPWELLVRNLHNRLRGIRVSPEEAFDLGATLEGEMRGNYRLFHLRRLVNKTWARLSLDGNMNGDLMYILARKGA